MAEKLREPQPEKAMVDRTNACHVPQREKIQTRIKRVIADLTQDLEDLKTLLKYLPDDMSAKDESRINRVIGNVSAVRRW